METRPPTEPSASTRDQAPKQLRRRPNEGHLGGVCAGLAEYFAIDPVIVRIAAVILAVSGPGVPAYVLAWIFVPEADDEAPSALSSSAAREDRGAQAFGIVLIVVALSVLWGGWWSPARRWLFPLGLIALGAWLVFRRTSASPEPSTAPPDQVGPTAWTPPSDAPALTAPAPGGWGATADEPSATAPTSGPDEGSDQGPAPDDDTTVMAPLGPPPPPVPPVPPWGGGHLAGAHPPRRPLTEEEQQARRRRKMVLPSVLGALLVWTGVAFLTGVSVQTGLAIALCIVGLGFVVGAFVGGSKVLVLPAMLLTGALVMSTVLDLPLRGPVGQRTWVPETAEQLEPFQLSVGEGTLDLTVLDVPDGATLEVEASVGIGRLLVIVPEDVALEVDGESALGEVTVFGRSSTGWGPSATRSFDRDRFDEVISLDLQVGIGQVEVVAEARSPERLLR